MLALLDTSAKEHRLIAALYQKRSREWVLPAVIFAEVDYMAGRYLGTRTQEAFLSDLAAGAYLVEWGIDEDLALAHNICKQYRSLRLGLVDAMVMATAQRLEADAIATLDLRHFSVVTLRNKPKLLPRDLE